MTEILTSAQMRAIEAAAIASGRVSGLELMERAGVGVIEAIFETWPELETPGDPAWRAAVLCGPGNNGGDGFVVARLLAARGWAVDVFFYGDAAKLPPDARTNHDRWAAMGAVRAITDETPDLSGAHLVVDAVFGIGFNRPIPSEVAGGVPVPAAPFGRLFRELCDFRDAGSALETVAERWRWGWPPVVAVDIPSGIASDSGELLVPERGETLQGARAWGVAADLTVTFHAPKPGHFRVDGPHHCGRLVVKSIGL